MKAKKNLINLLEEDILKTNSAIISINVDMSIIKIARKKYEGDELTEADKKIKELEDGLARMFEQKELLTKKLLLVRKYNGDGKAEGRS